MSGGGGFMSFMNSTIRKNRQLLKNKKKFKERNQLYNVVNPDKVNYEIRDVSEEEIKLRKKLKKSENDKTTILYFLMTIIILSISLNIYFGFFNDTEEKKPSRIILESSYRIYIKAGNFYMPMKDWSAAASNYKQAIEFLPEEFNGHQKLIFALTENCKEEYKSCIEARNHIEKIKLIFLEKKDELKKLLRKLWEIEKENYR